MFKIKEVILDNERELLISFLEEYDFEYEYDITYSILVYDEDKLVATASLANNVMKCFLVIKEYINQTTQNQKIKFLALDSNLGFAGGNNIGIKYALKNDFDNIMGTFYKASSWESAQQNCNLKHAQWRVSQPGRHTPWLQ